MSHTLVDLKHTKRLGEVPAGLATLCTTTDGIDPSGFVIDEKALMALRVAHHGRRDARFQEELRRRVGQGTVDDMKALVVAAPDLLEVLGVSVSGRAKLVAGLVDAVGKNPAAADVGRVAGGSLEPRELAALEGARRRAIIAAIIPALHDADEWAGAKIELTSERTEVVARFLPPGDAVELALGTALDEVLSQAAGVALGMEAIHRLLGSAPVEQLYGLLEEILVNAQAHLTRALFFEACHDADEDVEAQAGIEILAGWVQPDEAPLVAVVKGNPTLVWEVDVVAGRKLPIRDWLTSDPYCVLTMDDPTADAAERRTAVKRNTTKPRWDASFWFTSTRQGRLRIEVLDHDRFSADDPMGWWSISGTELPVGETVDDWYVLHDVKRGQLRVRITMREL